MPTYRNMTGRPVSFNNLKIYEDGGDVRRMIVTFAPLEEKALHFALPRYAEKGLELVDEDFPPLYGPIIFDNTLDYPEGVSREFAIRPCDRYFVQVIVQTGKVRMKFGRNGTPVVLDASLPVRTKFWENVDWESAPLLIIEGVEGGGNCTLHVNVAQSKGMV